MTFGWVRPLPKPCRGRLSVIPAPDKSLRGQAAAGIQSVRAWPCMARIARGRGARIPPSRYAAGHISGRGNDRVKVKPLLARVGNRRDFLPGEVSEEKSERIRRHERTGGPLSPWERVGVRETKRLEEAWGRILQRRKPGRKKGISIYREGVP